MYLDDLHVGHVYFECTQHERFHALSDKKRRINPALAYPLITPFPHNVDSPLSPLLGSRSLN